MSAIGTKQTSSLLAVNVCFRTIADIAGFWAGDAMSAYDPKRTSRLRVAPLF